jgi:glycosyltransferase involved in cell wall biosynthesis
VRVIHVAPTAFGSSGIFGGGERYPLELARALARRVPCELVTFGRQGREEREPGGLRVRVLPARVFLHGHPAHPFTPALIPALTRADIVHAHHLRAVPSRIAALAARAGGRHAVVTDHGLHGGDWRGLLPRLFDRFLAVSAYSARVLRLPPARTRVVYGGADPVRFAPDRDVVRRGVLFVGRITPHKGIDRLINALPAGAHLTVAGSSGHDRAWPERGYPALLRRLAAGRDVRFLDPVPDAILPDLYQQAAVFVLPSVHRTCYGGHEPTPELLGLAVLEAMASGIPVVCSRVGGLPEIVDHGVTGFLVEPGDEAELRERLAEILHAPDLAARLGRNARDLVLERFTWDACAARCLDVYEELCSPR